MKRVLLLIGTVPLVTDPFGTTSAQPSAHYPPGIEGLKAASLPPPGVYLRDYNLIYFSDRLSDASGDEIAAADPEVFVYANVPRLLWITDWKIFGGHVGFDALLPFQYKDIRINAPGGRLDDSTFGVGDFFAEVTLSWHVPQADFAVGYGPWAPTGDSSVSDPTAPGMGYWTHMFTAGMTWYMDAERRWTLAALGRYELNHEHQDADYRLGQVFTLDYGLSYAVTAAIDVGIAGYYQIRTTANRGAQTPNLAKDKVAGIGPEIVLFCPKIGLFTSIRYHYEFLAEARLQGHTGVVTLTYRF
ncbi:MAG: transporter [Verrucomicrobiota bacterium]|nr:transporter [Limisphaera sp.]MDW8381893.1 transporter [Verrucomicrobiota bacterium]